MFSPQNLSVLYEDNHLFVCEKPSGVLSQADGKDIPDMLTLIKAYLKEKYQKPGNVYLGLVHRLDLNVGGVMVFAKTSKAASRLSEDIRDREFSKKYYAVVHGKLPVGETKTLIDYLGKEEESRMGFVTDAKNGKEASLTYTVVETIPYKDEFLSLLAIELHSGRFHQIRVQMSHHGYPLYADQKYGGTETRHPEDLGLFAYELAFTHPVTKTELVFTIKPKEGIFSQFRTFK